MARQTAASPCRICAGTPWDRSERVKRMPREEMQGMTTARPVKASGTGEISETCVVRLITQGQIVRADRPPRRAVPTGGRPPPNR
jgi:hypothetical protein